jgi:hypothetical protein
VPADGVIDVDADLTLGAGDDARPYVVLAPSAAGEVTLRATTAGLTLVIDGLWLAVEGPAAGDTALVLDGDWARVILRNVTLDPGGERAVAPGDPPAAIPAVTLALAGTIGELIVESCITGPLVERTTALRPCSADVVILRDSLVVSRTADPAIDLVNGRLTVDRTTVMGDIVAGRLDASHLLVDGVVGVEDRQNGCFRFSAATGGSVVAHAYESTFFAGGLPPATFVSRRFGDPGFGQLAPDRRRRDCHRRRAGHRDRRLPPRPRSDRAPGPRRQARRVHAHQRDRAAGLRDLTARAKGEHP